MVFEARGENRQAADCYRRVIDFIAPIPTTTMTPSRNVFVKLVDKLDPLSAT